MDDIMPGFLYATCILIVGKVFGDIAYSILDDISKKYNAAITLVACIFLAILVAVISVFYPLVLSYWLTKERGGLW